MKKAVILIILLLIFVGCGKKNTSNGKFVEEKFLFGTYIKMIVYSDNEKKAHEAMEAAFNKIGEIDNKYNSKTKGSSIYKLNNSENKEIFLDNEGIEIFKEVSRVYKLSNGKYDITISPLLDLWGFGSSEERKNVPTESELKERLKEIDFDKVVLKNKKIILESPIKELDTGSFLKGYAIEQGKKVLREKGITSGFITSISSIATINGKPGGKPWKIGIQNPSNLQDILGLVEVKNKSLGISGDYQTYIEINGKKYHHIMDKQTGYPVKDKKLVVVICDSAFYADMYSTAFFNMTKDEIFRKAEELNVDVLVVDDKNQTQTTKNFHLNK